jgi:small-conductance mechanosensitive channel
MGNRWYHDKNGVVSSMRLIVMPAAYIGLLVVISSVIAFFLGIPDSVLLAGAGTTLITLSMGAKAWQRSSENSNV